MGSPKHVGCLGDAGPSPTERGVIDTWSPEMLIVIVKNVTACKSYRITSLQIGMVLVHNRLLLQSALSTPLEFPFMIH